MKQTTQTIGLLLLAAALIAATGLPARAEPVVADVQVLQVAADAWVVRVRASEAQAFDVIEPGVPFVVRLHRATLAAARAPLGAVPFGTVGLAEAAEGVEVRVTVASGLRVSASQGASADVVELHISPAEE